MVYPGLTALELIGTVSALSGLGVETGLHAVTVGERRAPTATDTPMRLLPERAFDEVHRPFGLIVPGGGPETLRALGDERLLGYVRAAAETAGLIGAVGTGSLVLAAAGLLVGRRATTHRAYRALLERLGATYVPERWVEDGPFITAGGTSGGIDMALHLVAKFKDERRARKVQLWIEYDPQPPFGGLDASAEDDDALATALAGREAEWRGWLAGRPDLLAAVEGALAPAGVAGAAR
ncbi:MAG TPA: DJ-1/PfpI family protein [Thermomicrobiales bacterium]|nr:DJ-1/PfpI family protein [Thermomicrobiales bacterium]